MKNLILIILGIVLMTTMLFGQASPTSQLRVANATTTFDVNIPVGNQVYDINTDLLYNCITATHADSTLTTAAAYFSVVGAAVVSSALTASGAMSVSNVSEVVGALAVDITVRDALADGATEGVASFTAADFDATAANISIDYTNGQAAATGAKGFLTAADWNTFTAKLDWSDTIGATDALATQYDISGFLTSEVDGSVTNEGSLTVGVGGANDADIISNTSGSTNVTIEGTTDHVLVTEGGSTIILDIDDGIADNKVVTVDQADAADDEYARFTAAGIESRSITEVKSDLGVGIPITEKFEEDDGTPTEHTIAQTPIGGEANVLVLFNGTPLETDQFVLVVGTKKLTMGITVSQYDRVIITYSYSN